MKGETHNTEMEHSGTRDPASTAPLVARKAWKAPQVITSKIDQETETNAGAGADLGPPGASHS